MTRRVPIVSTIVVLAAVATMIGLGIWQLGRLDEKEALIARYEQALDNPEIFSAFPAGAELDNLYRRTPFSCSEIQGWSAVAGRNANDQAGYVHIAQCPGAAIVVGWSRGPETPDWAGGEVTGMIAPGSELGWRIVADPPLAGLQANATPDPNDLPNNHLAYAGQWFFFALTALVIYVLALRKR